MWAKPVRSTTKLPHPVLPFAHAGLVGLGTCRVVHWKRVRPSSQCQRGRADVRRDHGRASMILEANRSQSHDCRDIMLRCLLHLTPPLRGLTRLVLADSAVSKVEQEYESLFRALLLPAPVSRACKMRQMIVIEISILIEA